MMAKGSFGQSALYTLSGFVYEKGSRETLPGVNIYFPLQKTGTVSNNYGFYSITLPENEYKVVFSFVGYTHEQVQIHLNRHITLDIFLNPSIELDEVVIMGDLVPSVTETPQMGVIEIPVRQIKHLPAFLGEKDVLKVIQLMPGVQKGTEGTSGFYVRGGGADQNLIILDDATVYNASHLFGFFSLFNGDAIKSIQLTKGGFPARYGGRLSSVLEMNMKDGNKEQFGGEAGIGLISSRLVLEGPIVKEKSSFIVSGRRTYLDLLVMPYMPKDERGGYFFYDLNAKMNYSLDEKNRFFVSAYTGRDKFYYRYKDNYSSEEAGIFWENATATMRWNHLFNNRLFANTSLIYSNYRLKIYIEEKYQEEKYELSYTSGIRDVALKYDLLFSPHPGHTLRGGLLTTFHRFTPSALVLKDDYIQEYKTEITAINVLESGLYVEDDLRIGERVRANAGVRLSHFMDGKKHYLKPEPRLSVSYLLPDNQAVKASYAEMNQYVHLLSNTGLGLPTDLWVPSTGNVPPQTSRQVSLGAARELKAQNLEFSLEGYYKKSDNVLTYREGASFLLIDDPAEGKRVEWEQNVTSGQAWAYGMEILVQRKTGKLTGWVGYTLSWVQWQFEEINFGKKFYPRYDRRHDISVVAVYELSGNVVFSGIWVYGTGNAITLPIGEYIPEPHDPQGFSQYYYGYGYVNDYGEKNSFRMAPYHRLDFSAQFIKKKEKSRRTWEVSVYNLYNRKNPFFYFIGYDDADNRVLKQISLFPLIPSVTYSVQF